MALDFIFVAIIVMIVLAIISIYFKNMIMAMISGLMMMTIGVNIFISGVLGIFNSLTSAFAIIFTLFGFYLFIVPSIEYIETHI